MRNYFLTIGVFIITILFTACASIEEFAIFCDGFSVVIAYEDGNEGAEVFVTVTEDKGTVLFSEKVAEITSDEAGTLSVAATFNTVPTSPVTIRVDGFFEETFVTGDCNGTRLAALAFTDGRINKYDAGSPVVLYGTYDQAGERGLAIYAANESGLIHLIPASAFQAVGRCPAENTTVFSGASGIIVSVLPQRPDGSCPYQVNAPTGEANKVYVIIFDDLFTDTYYESYEAFIGA